MINPAPAPWVYEVPDHVKQYMATAPYLHSVNSIRTILRLQCGITSAPPAHLGKVVERVVCPCDDRRGEGAGMAELQVTLKPTGYVDWICFHCGSKSTAGISPAFPKSDGAEEWRRTQATQMATRRSKGDMNYAYEMPKPVYPRGHDPRVDAYLAGRGLTKETLDAFGVFLRQGGMKQVLRDATTGVKTESFIDCLVFPYKDASGRIKNYKKRSIQFNDDGTLRKKRFTQSPKAEPNIYMPQMLAQADNWKFYQQVIFVEGEIDVMTMWQCGFTEATTLPAGASSNDNTSRVALLKEPRYDWLLGRKPSVVLAGDNDASGTGDRLMGEIANVFGHDKCCKVSWGAYKDANECFLAEGAEGINRRVMAATPYILAGAHNG